MGERSHILRALFIFIGLLMFIAAGCSSEDQSQAPTEPGKPKAASGWIEVTLKPANSEPDVNISGECNERDLNNIASTMAFYIPFVGAKVAKDVKEYPAIIMYVDVGISSPLQPEKYQCENGESQEQMIITLSQTLSQVKPYTLVQTAPHEYSWSDTEIPPDKVAERYNSDPTYDSLELAVEWMADRLAERYMKPDLLAETAGNGSPTSGEAEKLEKQRALADKLLQTMRRTIEGYAEIRKIRSEQKKAEP